MRKYRVSVSYGDDHLRTYEVEAQSLFTAETTATNHALGLLSVEAHDDIDEYDGEIDDSLAEQL